MANEEREMDGEETVKQIHRRTAFTFAILSLVVVSGCFRDGYGDVSRNQAVNKKSTIQIVATTGMVADLVEHIVKERGTVTTIIKLDPHLFKPDRSVTKKLYEADIVFYSGLMLEGRMQDVLQAVDRPDRPSVAITSRLEREEKDYLRSPPEFEGHFDPHVWMDVQAWSRCMEVIVETMSKFDPEHAEEYKVNAKAYQEELVQLDQYVRQVVSSIPESLRILVTAHDAFGYFGRTYGMDVRSVQGVTTESEAGIQDVNRLVDFLVEKHVPAVFFESSVNEKNIRAVIEGTAARGFNVTVGGELFSDAMGNSGTYEGTYIGMIDHNATLIARALGGTAPERGFQDKLSASHP